MKLTSVSYTLAMSYLSCFEHSIGHDWLCNQVFSERLQVSLVHPGRLDRLERQVSSLPGVQRVRCHPDTQRLEIHYDMRRLKRTELERQIARLQEA